MCSIALKAEPRRNPLERALGLITEVKPTEGRIALLLTVNAFLVLTACYLMKPVREALILATPSGAEYKSYSSAGIAILLLGTVPLYAAVARRVPRNRLIAFVTIFFVCNLAGFYWWALQGGGAALGIVFFLWFGIFNMLFLSQFWAFANDVYCEEQGKRLFALVGLGASLGAVFGSKMSELLVKPIGLNQLLLLSAGLLVACLVLTEIVHRAVST